MVVRKLECVSLREDHHISGSSLLYINLPTGLLVISRGGVLWGLTVIRNAFYLIGELAHVSYE